MPEVRITWVGQDGKEYSKIYTKAADASKAYAWLLRNEAKSISVKVI